MREALFCVVVLAVLVISVYISGEKGNVCD
jgi:hypothetical protein